MNILSTKYSRWKNVITKIFLLIKILSTLYSFNEKVFKIKTVGNETRSLDMRFCLFIIGVFCPLVLSQALYEPTVAKNTLLNDGVQTTVDTLLNTCEKCLQDEDKMSKELANNLQNLRNNLQTTSIALMALQQKVVVPGQYCFDFIVN